MPKPIEPCPDQPALIKIGSGADRRGAAVTFQSAEVPGQMFQDILLLIARMPAPASPADGVRYAMRLVRHNRGAGLEHREP
jgi:hypothetical protein